MRTIMFLIVSIVLGFNFGTMLGEYTSKDIRTFKTEKRIR